MTKHANSTPAPSLPTRLSRVVARLLQSPLLEGLRGRTQPTAPRVEARALSSPPRPRHPPPALSWAELTVRYPILHTDDELPLLDLFNLLLVREGLTVLRTTLGHQALDICQHVPVSLVITDISKPDLSGVQLLQRLQADPATAHIPVMFLTAHPTVDACAVYDKGAVAFYTKPLSPLDFIRVVYETLNAYGSWHTPPHIDPATSQRLITQYRAG